MRLSSKSVHFAATVCVHPSTLSAMRLRPEWCNIIAVKFFNEQILPLKKVNNICGDIRWGHIFVEACTKN